MSWEILFYVTPNGQPVVRQFIDGLSKQAEVKTSRMLVLLRELGSDLGMPYTKAMGSGLVELRIRGKQEVRIFYIYQKGRRIYLLHGFIKKTQQTPKKELAIARDRQKEIERL